MIKVAVSGSNGFVGKVICRILSEKGYMVIPIDITNGFDLSKPDCIDNMPEVNHFIHLANLVFVPKSYEDPYSYYRINYMTTLNVLEYCRKNNAHMIYSSSYVYGSPQYLPVDEKHSVNPFNPYAQTKVLCESLCEGYHRDFGVNVTVLRPFNLYGERQAGKLLIPEIISQLKEGRHEIRLKAATPRRDYVNVEDVANAFITCLNDKPGLNIYNVCSGSSLSVKEITDIINKHLKEKVKFTFSQSDRPNEVDETVGSYKKLSEIGWKPTISFEEGISRIIESEGL